jgi:hypothetical protein
MEADYISGLQPASEIWHPISNNEGYQLEANFIDYTTTLIYYKNKKWYLLHYNEISGIRMQI